MFTSLNNILGLNQPRHAEQNDTRQDIQRHDPEYERRKRKKQESKEDLFAGENGETVSVQALTLFLNKFLKELSDKPKQGFNATSLPDNEETPNSQENKPPTSGPAAQAASAYQHSAQSQQQTSILGDINENNADLISLDGSEIRIIHGLLKDLKFLSDKGIEYIHIERASSFLQSLINAVETVKKSNLFQD